jgi:hypothetical protein
MKFLPILPLLTLGTTFSSHTNTNNSIQRQETRRDGEEVPIPSPTAREAFPRLVMYIQTCTTPDKQLLSLLPPLKYETKVTHVILASVHLHEEPGVIRLNNDPFKAPTWDVIWEEVKILQENGIKVMALLGGAAAGTYLRLNGTGDEVSVQYEMFPKFASREAVYARKLCLDLRLMLMTIVLLLLSPPPQPSSKIQPRRFRY